MTIKFTEAKLKKIRADWTDYNRMMVRVGSSTKTLDEYIRYRKGQHKGKLRGTKLPEYKVSNHREEYKSQSEIGVAFAKKENVYTGTLIRGIATMHKSNAVPIISDQDAIDISEMRR